MKPAAARAFNAVNQLVLAMLPSCRQIARNFHLTTIDLQLLHLIHLQRSPTTASALCSLSNLPSSTMTGILDRLEEGEFICRSADLHDRRVRVIKTVPDRLEPIIAHFDSARRALEAELSTCSEYELNRMYELFHGSADMPALFLPSDATTSNTLRSA